MERGDLSRSASFSVWGPLLLLALLTAVVRLPFVAEPPGRDQALFMTQAQRLAAGGRLYADVWEHKQPGIVALYGGAMAIAGDSYTAIQLLNAIAGFTTQIFFGLIFVMVFEAFFESSSLPQPMSQPDVITYIWLGQALLALLPWLVRLEEMIPAT